jgi:shikimate dehydrogenase
MGAVSSKHRAFDLIYNPEETLFLKSMRERGAKTKNGLEMLKAQAEESWRLW